MPSPRAAPHFGAAVSLPQLGPCSSCGRRRSVGPRSQAAARALQQVLQDGERTRCYTASSCSHFFKFDLIAAAVAACSCQGFHLFFCRSARRNPASHCSSACLTAASMPAWGRSTSAPPLSAAAQSSVSNPPSFPLSSHSFSSHLLPHSPPAAPALVRNPGVCPPSARNIRDVGDDAM